MDPADNSAIVMISAHDVSVARPRDPAPPTIVSVSAAMETVTTLARRAAQQDSKVLITGESGVGKDLIARLMHLHSPRAERPFVAVNCAGLSETLLESELFGHVKGSFTGAYRDKLGKIEMANGGTIFLDEIGETNLRMQALLLRFLENGEIQPVGSDCPSAKVDVRVVTATNRDLTSLVVTGLFREDLLYRIRVVHIHVPALRERREDIRPLIDHLLAKTRSPVAFAEDALRALEQYRWPGNVRELQNVIEQLTCTVPGDTVGLEHLPPALRTPGGSLIMPTRERRRQVADDLYDGLLHGSYRFWEHVHVMFLMRDLTRQDLRDLVRRGLSTTCGNYRALLKLFGMDGRDYKRFLNFLSAHDCAVDFREFRTGPGMAPSAIRKRPMISATLVPRKTAGESP